MPFESVVNLAVYNALPEPVKANYRASTAEDAGVEEGSYIVEVTPHNSGLAFENVAGLKNTLGKFKHEATTLKAQVALFGDVAPGDVQTLQTELESLKGKLAKGTDSDKVKAQVEAQIAEIKTALEKEKNDLSTVVSERDSAIEKLLIDNEALAALKELEGNDVFMLHHIQSQAKVVWKDGKPVAYAIDKEGVERVTLQEGKTDPMTITELVGLMSKEKRFEGAFPGSGAKGSGAAGSPSGGGAGKNEDLSLLSPEELLQRSHEKVA